MVLIVKKLTGLLTYILNVVFASKFIHLPRAIKLNNICLWANGYWIIHTDFMSYSFFKKRNKKILFYYYCRWWRRPTNIHSLLLSFFVWTIRFHVGFVSLFCYNTICIGFKWANLQAADLHMKWMNQTMAIWGFITTPFLFNQVKKRDVHLLMQAVYLFGLSIWFVIVSILNYYLMIFMGKFNYRAFVLEWHLRYPWQRSFFYGPIKPNWRATLPFQGITYNYDSAFNYNSSLLSLSRIS